MAGGVIKSLLVVFSVISLYNCHAEEKLDPIEKCSQHCQKSYALHTTITDGEPTSCARGCRFYSIAKFTVTKGTKSVSVFDTCNQSCDEAYSMDKSLAQPCKDGCKFQQTEDTKEQQNTEPTSEDDASLLARLEHATPIMQVRKVMAQVVDGFHIVRTQVLTYFLGDNNKLIAVASSPEIFINVVPGEGGSNVHHESPEDLLTQQSEHRREDMMANPETETVTRVSLDPRRYNYMMHLLLLLAGVTVAMLGLTYCLAVARTRQHKTLKAANLNLALQQEPLKLVRPEDLTKLSLMEEEEAPPLPNKQDFNLNHANV